MTTHSGKNGLVACPNNHPNAHDSSACDTCGLPIIRFEAQLDILLRTLAEERHHLGAAPQKLFIGVGEQGCRLVRDFHRSWGAAQGSFAFLMVDSATDARYASSAAPGDRPAGEDAASPLTLYLIPSPEGAQKGYYALGERLAAGDPKIDDCLRRSGIRSTSGNQSLFLLSALGGATGSGATPNILHRAKANNPQLRSIVTALLPGPDEPDSAHFNAFCSLSQFIRQDRHTSTDMILLVDQDRLNRVRGVSSSGEEVAREALLSHMAAMLAGAVQNGDPGEADPAHLAKMSRSMGVRSFVPCLAIGRSLEIFGSLSNILNSAVSCPLAEMDRSSVLLSFLLVRVPQKLASSLQKETLRADLNRWNRQNFPHLKGSALQLSHYRGGADRVDVCLLLGGNPMAITANRAKAGFDRFKAVVGKKSWEEEFGASSKSVLEVEKAMKQYDTRLAEIAR
jgi:hypothetical protein